MPKLNAGLIKYFWTEKGDIRRYSDYNDADAKRQFPHLAEALINYERAHRLLTLEVKALEEEDDE
jgi:hypothetical protein